MYFYVLRCEMTVSRPIGEVFSVFENPRNLALITPPWLGFKVLTEGALEMRPGLVIDYRIRSYGMPLRWRTLITDYVRGKHFVDESIRGPYQRWRHLHEFTETDGGTLVRDTVVYDLPFGWLGRMAHAIRVKRQLLEIFSYRQERLNRHWGGTARYGPPIIQPLGPEAVLPEIANPEARRLA